MNETRAEHKHLFPGWETCSCGLTCVEVIASLTTALAAAEERADRLAEASSIAETGRLAAEAKAAALLKYIQRQGHDCSATGVGYGKQCYGCALNWQAYASLSPTTTERLPTTHSYLTTEDKVRDTYDVPTPRTTEKGEVDG